MAEKLLGVGLWWFGEGLGGDVACGHLVFKQTLNGITPKEAIVDVETIVEVETIMEVETIVEVGTILAVVTGALWAGRVREFIAAARAEPQQLMFFHINAGKSCVLQLSRLI